MHFFPAATEEGTSQNRDFHHSIAFVIWGIALLPISFQPNRAEAHEAFRAGALLLLVLCSLPWLRNEKIQCIPARFPLVAAIALHCLALIASTLFSLSPSRSLLGDTMRAMGLLTNLALVACAFWGARTHLRSTWLWFWLAGVVVAGYVCLEVIFAVAGSEGLRANGPMGSPLSTGGWLALSFLWVTVGLHSQTLSNRLRTRRFWIYGGLTLMFVAVVFTQSRGATLGLLSGLVTFALIKAALGHRSWLIATLPPTILLALGIVALSNMSSGLMRAVIPENIPLVRRFQSQTEDLSRAFREAVWANSISLVQNWPLMRASDGTTDPLFALRPFVGYGLEMTDIVYRPLANTAVHLDNARVDRAHNDWLDTLLTTGWLGIAGRAAIWAAVWYVALRRVNLWRPGAALLPLACGAICAAMVDSPWQPVALTFGAVTGAWLWLLLVGLRHSERVLRHDASPSLLALTIGSAHLIALQFNFSNVTNDFILWLAVGVLLATPAQTNVTEFANQRPRFLVWSALAVALLAYTSLALDASPIQTMAVSVFPILAVQVFSYTTQRILFVVYATGMVIGLVAVVHSPQAIVVVDTTLLVGGVWILGEASISWKRMGLRHVFLLALFILGWLMWRNDGLAGIYLQQSLRDTTGPYGTESAYLSAQYRPWDDQLSGWAGYRILRSIPKNSEAEATLFALSHQLLQRAAALNPYDADYALGLASVEANLAIKYPEQSQHQESADAYFASAAEMLPADPSVWYSWSQFSYQVAGDLQNAHDQALKAACLQPESHVFQAWLQILRHTLRLAEDFDCETVA